MGECEANVGQQISLCSSSSRGFLLVLKNYPFSETKDFFCCFLALETGSDSE